MKKQRRMSFALASAVAAILLSACALPSTQPLLIRFIDERIDLDGIQWMEKAAIEHGVELDPRGIYALDENRVFLFGGVSVPAGTIRSFLLRSDDGGEHWSEVMAPVRGSIVTEVVFVEDGYGWALVVWTVEGWGPACLFQTANYGENWQKLSDIPYPGGHSVTANLQFFDRQQGQVATDQYMTGNWCILNSGDGGLTWEETSNCCDASECSFERYSEDTALAQDGTRWRFEVDSFDVARELRQIRISRQSSTDDAWTVVNSIPVHYEYLDGQPVIPQRE